MHLVVTCRVLYFFTPENDKFFYVGQIERKVDANGSTEYVTIEHDGTMARGWVSNVYPLFKESLVLNEAIIDNYRITYTHSFAPPLNFKTESGDDLIIRRVDYYKTDNPVFFDSDNGFHKILIIAHVVSGNKIWPEREEIGTYLIKGEDIIRFEKEHRPDLSYLHETLNPEETLNRYKHQGIF